jgi:hypothetical protein
MRPAEVLRMQADLAAALGPGQPAGAQLIETSENQEVVEGDNRDHVRQLCAAHVQHGRAFLITEHMSEVAQRRADDEQRIPPTTHCPTDIEPPRPAGFVVFEQPMVLPEIRGREQLCHVLTWGGALSRNPGTGRQHRGWLLTTWNDIARRPDQVVREAIAADRATAARLGRWWPVHSVFFPHDQRLGAVNRPIHADERAAMEARYGTDPPIVTAVVPNPRRLFVAMWQLLGETTHVHGATEEETGHPDRGAFRMARRLGMQSDITVITLRRPAEPTQHPGSGTPLDHRVPVCQHTRHYWVRDVDGVLRREPRIIAEHIRGPEGAPLITTKKIERLSR